LENKKKIVVFASGNGSGFENICKKLSDKEYLEISKLYCNNNKAPVLDRAKKYGIEKFIFKNQDLKNKKVLLDLQKVKPDLIVLVGFLRKIPFDISNEFKHKIINIHPSLLPKYGGKGMYGDNVHKKVIENNEIESGFTIHYVDQNYDEGDIIFQKKIQIKKKDALNLAKEILKLEHKYYPEIILKCLSNGKS
jgi:phosphoribosylglycinamide formyltransferase-1